MSLAILLGVQLNAAMTAGYTSHRVGRQRRRIDIPVPDLAFVQDRILRRVLRLIPRHPAAHGEARGTSTRTATLPHCGAEALVTMDLHHWYPSITEDQVRVALRCDPWPSESPAEAAARIAWRTSWGVDPTPYAADLARLLTYRGALPQGATTSPAVANLVTYPVDVWLSRLDRAYTRYADDIMISLDDVEPRASLQGHKLARWVGAVVARMGWQLNPSKTRVMVRPAPLRALGLDLSGDAPRLPRRERRKMRAIEHQAAQTGDISPRDAGRLAHARSYGGSL